MAALVADYHGSTSESDSDDSTENHDLRSANVTISSAGFNNSSSNMTEGKHEKLPSPNFNNLNGKINSVFANPFRDAEDAENSILEKHVKMTPNEILDSQGGNQVCWKFRKGKCRFGHNCKFLHDNDIRRLPEHTDATSQNNSNFYQLNNRSIFPTCCGEDEENESIKKRKKVGLSNTIIPPKKALKAYQNQQKIERPWTVAKKLGKG